MFDSEGWEQSPILYEEWAERIKKEPELAVKLRMNRGAYLKRELEYRTNGRNAIISISGGTGGGKSFAAIRLAYWINKLYKTENKPEIFFKPEEALEALPDIKTPNTMILDEAVPAAGTGSGRTIAEFRTLEETIRAKQLSMIFCSPTLHRHVAHFTLEAYGIKSKEKISKLVLYTPDQVAIGFVIIKSPTSEMLLNYTKQKQEFLENVQQRKVVGGKTKQTAQDCMNDETFMNEYDQCPNKGERIALIISTKNTGKSEAEEIDAMIAILKRRQN